MAFQAAIGAPKFAVFVWQFGLQLEFAVRAMLLFFRKSPPMVF